MNQAFSLQKPLVILVLLLLIDLSLPASAMRIYAAYASPAAWSQQLKQDIQDLRSRPHRPIVTAPAVAGAMHPQSISKALASYFPQMDHPPHNVASSHHSADCRGSAAPSPSSQYTDCSGSPAPEEVDGSEIDPRYGVEKRLVPTGPNPLHN